jgi:hypothetical protein
MVQMQPRSPSLRTLIGLGLKRNAASLVGYTINCRLTAGHIAKLAELSWDYGLLYVFLNWNL